MKQIIFILALTVSLRAAAQPEYPVPQTALNLTSVEYFFDKDPGTGNGRRIAIPASTNTAAFQFQADLSGLPTGFHRLYIRSFDAGNRHSLLNWIFFDNYILPPYKTSDAPVNVVAMEYYFDTDPGFGNGRAIPLALANEVPAHPVSINVTGLSPGVHRLFIRSKDANNKWSLINFAQFDNTSANPYPSAPAPASAIGEMEYYFDNDPGFGNGMPIQFNAATAITDFSVDIPLNTVAPGAHTFYIRSRQNPWSFSAYVPFMYSSTLPVTWLYVKGEIKEAKSFISWATATEDQTDKFLIEHSTDGQRFEMIGQTPAAGNSGSTEHYQFIHSQPSTGMNYYRIKQLDKNGKFTYSNALHLLYRPDQTAIMIAPNPVTDNLYIIAGTANKLSKLNLYDASGKLILTRSLLSGQQVYSVDVSRLNKGTYIIQLQDDKHTTSHRFIRQ